jgi:hypothetical protein
MKKLFLMCAVLTLGTAIAFAQETSSSPSSSSQSGASASTQSSPSDTSSQNGSTTTTTQQTTTTTEQSSTGNPIQGCLSGSAGNYMLSTNTGVTYKLLGSDSQLADNVNKQVEVMGTPGSSATASASNSPDNGSTAGTANNTAESGTTGSAHASASATKTLEVSSVHKIADTCSSMNGSQTAPQQ